jgi:putative membrane protein insertion efficiency factor
MRKMSLLNLLASAMLSAYKAVVSPWLMPACRFTPTCSEYASEAFRRYGFFRAASLSLHRLMQCHPWGKTGYDPVPDKKQ